MKPNKRLLAVARYFRSSPQARKYLACRELAVHFPEYADNGYGQDASWLMDEPLVFYDSIAMVCESLAYDGCE